MQNDYEGKEARSELGNPAQHEMAGHRGPTTAAGKNALRNGNPIAHYIWHKIVINNRKCPTSLQWQMKRKDDWREPGEAD